MRETKISDLTLVGGRTYRIVASGTVTHAGTLSTNRSDALYCFDGCARAIHFNHQLLAFFVQRPGEPVPDEDHGEWVAIDDPDGPGSQPYAGRHTYTASFGTSAPVKLMLRTVINYDQDDANRFSGSFTVRIFGQSRPRSSRPCPRADPLRHGGRRVRWLDARAAWQDGGMRRASIADSLAGELRARERGRSAAEQVARALALGRRDLALYAVVSGLSPAAARRAVERRRQARRRPSAALAALLA